MLEEYTYLKDGKRVTGQFRYIAFREPKESMGWKRSTLVSEVFREEAKS